MAGEVLGGGEDLAFGEALLKLGCGGGVSGWSDEGEGVDGEVFAVGAVGVPVEFGDEGSFYDGTGGEGAGEGVEALDGQGTVFGEGDGYVADGAGLGGADGGSGGFANLVCGEVLDLAEAYDEEALGFEVGRVVEQEGLAEAGFELAAAEGADGERR